MNAAFVLLRARAKMTQPQIADLCGVTAAAVRTWEQNTSRPAGRYISKLLKILCKNELEREALKASFKIKNYQETTAMKLRFRLEKLEARVTKLEALK